jgi:hypothetical protein
MYALTLLPGDCSPSKTTRILVLVCFNQSLKELFLLIRLPVANLKVIAPPYGWAAYLL